MLTHQGTFLSFSFVWEVFTKLLVCFDVDVQTFEQFEFDGCDNCDEFLRMKNNKDNIYDCTSNNFDGWVEFTHLIYLTMTHMVTYLFLRMVALMSPEDSWVAKWQRISEYLLDAYWFPPEMISII